MSEDTQKMYEGLFLFPQAAISNLDAASSHVQDMLTKVGAELIAFRKWDDRRLAYPIKGNKRGVFFLAYFKVVGTVIGSLERNLLLSEEVLRFMITRCDHLTLEQIEATEGRTELADEIKLRDEKKTDDTDSGVRATTKSQRDAEETADPTEPSEASEDTPAAPVDAQEEAPAESTEEPATS